MKRSEMIKLLKQTIKYTKSEHLAQRILEVQEQVGMLPPDKRPASSQLTTKDWKIERDKWVQKTFAWEPEDV